MRHSNLRLRDSAGVKRLVLISAVTGAMLGTAALSTSAAFHSPRPTAAQPAAAQLVARPTAAQLVARAEAVKPVVQPDSALARAFRRYFHQRAVSGMTAWIKSGIEQSNEAILIQARGDAMPHRNAALPADSAALEASAKDGLANPSPEDKAGWDKIMRDEITLAKELPVPVEGDAATAEAQVIEMDFVAFAEATS